MILIYFTVSLLLKTLPSTGISRPASLPFGSFSPMSGILAVFIEARFYESEIIEECGSLIAVAKVQILCLKTASMNLESLSIETNSR